MIWARADAGQVPQARMHHQRAERSCPPVAVNESSCLDKLSANVGERTHAENWIGKQRFAQILSRLLHRRDAFDPSGGVVRLTDAMRREYFDQHVAVCRVAFFCGLEDTGERRARAFGVMAACVFR
jgi:hypothetical protein